MLVVVGILIALEINNWNENKKDLTLDTLDINFNIRYHSVFINEEKKLLNFLTGNLERPETTIDYNAALTTPLIIVLHESTFANLQNNNIGIVTNNDLRKDISRFYDFFTAAVKKIENDLSSYETYDVKLPYFLKYCKVDPNSPPMLFTNPNSKVYYNPEFKKQAIVLSKVTEAKQDEGFKISLNESIFFRQVTIDVYADMLYRNEELTNEIDIELRDLKE